MNRTRDMGYDGGYDIRDAKVWQRRVYSGIVRSLQSDASYSPLTPKSFR